VRVKALLRRGAVSRANALRVTDLEIDRLTQQVRRGGQRIELTGKEYALLEYLMTNAGRVLSRTMIIEHVLIRFKAPFFPSRQAARRLFYYSHGPRRNRRTRAVLPLISHSVEE